jgi:hypothetical protein
MENKYVEIAKFDAWAEADIVRCRLTALGISAVLIGPDTSSTLGMYMGVASKVSVMVPEKLANRAKKVLLKDAEPISELPKKARRSSSPRTRTRKKIRSGG